MITKQQEGAAPDLNIDLWSVPITEVAALLDAVSPDCFIRYAFSVLLNRSPDPAGAAHYRDRILAGSSRPSVVADLLDSDEFLNRHGAKHLRQMTIEEFVRQTYQNILGRWPDESGLQTYVRIGKKWRGRTKVERNILQSAEARRLGGGRLGRINALKLYARQSRILKMPIVGTRLRRHNELVARLARIERLMTVRPTSAPIQTFAAPPMATHPPVLPTVEPQNMLANAVEQFTTNSPNLPALREARIETLDTASATKLQKDGWVFRVAVRDERRRESARSGTAKAKT